VVPTSFQGTFRVDLKKVKKKPIRAHTTRAREIDGGGYIGERLRARTR
jgi:hypothetical protein